MSTNSGKLPMTVLGLEGRLNTVTSCHISMLAPSFPDLEHIKGLEVTVSHSKVNKILCDLEKSWKIQGIMTVSGCSCQCLVKGRGPHVIFHLNPLKLTHMELNIDPNDDILPKRLDWNILKSQHQTEHKSERNSKMIQDWMGFLNCPKLLKPWAWGWQAVGRWSSHFQSIDPHMQFSTKVISQPDHKSTSWCKDIKVKANHLSTCSRQVLGFGFRFRMHGVARRAL